MDYYVILCPLNYVNLYASVILYAKHLKNNYANIRFIIRLLILLLVNIICIIAHVLLGIYKNTVIKT